MQIRKRFRFDNLINIVIIRLMENIKLIGRKKSQQKDMKKEENFNEIFYCIGFFLAFIIMVIIFSLLEMNNIIRFFSILIGAFILEDIHHTLKRLWIIKD